ncbi:MAG: hypothetical protein OXI44_08370 [Bacteroidota bacterium]|nr:hypothetical protein [Bacteroidota bacterium]
MAPKIVAAIQNNPQALPALSTFRTIVVYRNSPAPADIAMAEANNNW